jgi:hypothetical protein
MDQNGYLIFKPRFKYFVVFYGGHLLILLMVLVTFILVVNPLAISIGVKVILAILSLVYLVYVVHDLTFPFFTSLKLSAEGVSYSELFYSIFSEWEDITETEIGQGTLLLKVGSDAIVKISFFYKFFFKRKDFFIPLHFFVRSWNYQ